MSATRSRTVRRLVGQLGQAVAVMLIVTVLVFLVVRLVPGDPAKQALGDKATPAAIHAVQHQLGLDQPILDQFIHYFLGLLHGDMGTSLIRRSVPVLRIVGNGLGITGAVVCATVVLSLASGIPLGMLAARRKGLVSAGVRTTTIVLLAAPPFFLGLVLILFFSIELQVLPAGGWTGARGLLSHLVLPAIALSGYLMPLVMRTVRQAAIDVSSQAFIEAAAARGLSERRITYAHILPNSLLPVISLIGLNVGWLISGAVVVEAVFALPGLGSQLANAVQQLDYPVIQGVALISALVVVVSNLVADALYALVDPRVRSER